VEEWSHIPPIEFQTLVESLPRCTEAVLGELDFTTVTIDTWSCELDFTTVTIDTWSCELDFTTVTIDTWKLCSEGMLLRRATEDF
jgi:hypothetical protein